MPSIPYARMPVLSGYAAPLYPLAACVQHSRANVVVPKGVKRCGKLKQLCVEELAVALYHSPDTPTDG